MQQSNGLDRIIAANVREQQSTISPHLCVPVAVVSMSVRYSDGGVACLSINVGWAMTCESCTGTAKEWLMSENAHAEMCSLMGDAAVIR